jgi:hypothetical protein
MPIRDNAGWRAWKEGLPAAEREEVERRYARYLYEVARPSAEWYFDEYREISPGFSVPMRFGYAFLGVDAEGTYAKTRRDLRVMEVKANVELPGDLFVMEMREGVQVVDRRYDPPLSYPFKKDFSREEWQEILASQKQPRAGRSGGSGDEGRPASTVPSTVPSEK